MHYINGSSRIHYDASMRRQCRRRLKSTILITHHDACRAASRHGPRSGVEIYAEHRRNEIRQLFRPPSSWRISDSLPIIAERCITMAGQYPLAQAGSLYFSAACVVPHMRFCDTISLDKPADRDLYFEEAVEMA